MKLFQSKGRQAGIAGVYPWTMEQFVELASLSGAAWVSQPDLCCEPELAVDQQAIDYRMNATATLLEGMLRVVYAWQEQLARTMNANDCLRSPGGSGREAYPYPDHGLGCSGAAPLRVFRGKPTIRGSRTGFCARGGKHPRNSGPRRACSEA
ncbi:hypothetical protein J8I87_43125 [Paraburkholderia sp. LEh10]|nr:hypothetical protein [Paraburkholderia sp. LEh10]